MCYIRRCSNYFTRKKMDKEETPGMNKADVEEKPPMTNRCEEEKSPRQRLHEANLRVTRPRLLVLSLLHEKHNISLD